MKQTERYGVIGNPISHSISPAIHSQFARQFSQPIDYQKYLVEPDSDSLKKFIFEFFDEGGKGLNVTLPFKLAVINCLDKISDEALIANSVNTISIDPLGLLQGHTTDGQGLILDFAAKNFNLRGKNILVIGAGGASQSILPALLTAGARVQLLNRSQNKVTELIKRFSTITNHSSTTCFLPYQPNTLFDCVISATSEFNLQLFQPLTANINHNTFCYDLNYGKRAENFKDFALNSGSGKFSDGLGMLIGQAAKSYQIWHGQLPDISKINWRKLVRQTE